MGSVHFPPTSITGINYRIDAMIIAGIGDFNRFYLPDKILAYAGLSSSTYQSRQPDSSCSHMEKRSFRYLCYALFNGTKYICIRDNNKMGAYISFLSIGNDAFLVMQFSWCDLSEMHFCNS